jgi:4-hydroxy-2-oxoglutarate aldolase
MNDDALVRHFLEVADGSRIPVLIYNVPAYTHLVISVSAVRVLSGHPNIVGMKDSSGDVPRLAALKAALPESFELIVGTASALYPALTLGVRAGILALANFAGSACARVQALCEAGKHEEARALYLKLLPVNAAITATYGVPGLKYASGLAGYSAGHVRKPLLPPSAQAQEQIRQALATAGLAP